MSLYIGLTYKGGDGTDAGDVISKRGKIEYYGKHHRYTGEKIFINPLLGSGEVSTIK